VAPSAHLSPELQALPPALGPGIRAAEAATPAGEMASLVTSERKGRGTTTPVDQMWGGGEVGQPANLWQSLRAGRTGKPNPKIEATYQRNLARARQRQEGGPETQGSTAAQAARLAQQDPDTPLPHADQVQASMPGVDLSQIRAKQGPSTQQGLGMVGARGFAVGNTVALKPGVGPEVVGEEVAHTLQQGDQADVPDDLAMTSPTDAVEMEAKGIGAAVAQGEQAPNVATQANGLMLARSGEGEEESGTSDPLPTPEEMIEKAKIFISENKEKTQKYELKNHKEIIDQYNKSSAKDINKLIQKSKRLKSYPTEPKNDIEIYLLDKHQFIGFVAWTKLKSKSINPKSKKPYNINEALEAASRTRGKEIDGKILLSEKMFDMRVLIHEMIHTYQHESLEVDYKDYLRESLTERWARKVVDEYKIKHFTHGYTEYDDLMSQLLTIVDDEDLLKLYFNGDGSSFEEKIYQKSVEVGYDGLDITIVLRNETYDSFYNIIKNWK